MTGYSEAALDQVEKLRLLALLPELAVMKPAHKILSDEDARKLISQMVKNGEPFQRKDSE